MSPLELAKLDERLEAAYRMQLRKQELIEELSQLNEELEDISTELCVEMSDNNMEGCLYEVDDHLTVFLSRQWYHQQSVSALQFTFRSLTEESLLHEQAA